MRHRLRTLALRIFWIVDRLLLIPPAPFHTRSFDDWLWQHGHHAEILRRYPLTGDMIDCPLVDDLGDIR